MNSIVSSKDEELRCMWIVLWLYDNRERKLMIKREKWIEICIDKYGLSGDDNEGMFIGVNIKESIWMSDCLEIIKRVTLEKIKK
jgi:hypothetical protein